MQVLIDELPPQSIWNRHTHGTRLVDYPIRRHSVAQSNPDADQDQWIPEPAFHEYSMSTVEGRPRTFFKKARKRIKAASAIASSGDSSSLVKLRGRKIRDKIGSFLGLRPSGQGHDRAKEPLELGKPTGLMSLMLWPFRRVQRKFGHRKESVGCPEMETENPGEPSAKAKGKEREVQLELEPESSVDE